jgi:putative ABC transport system permease protein
MGTSKGAVARDQLFGPDVDPTGATIRIRQQPFKVIGVLARKGQSPMGQDQDDTIFVPVTTALKRLLGETSVANVPLTAADGIAPEPLAHAAAAVLRRRHRIAPGEPDDFTIRSSDEMANLSPAALVLSFGFAAAIGAFFGIDPARRAASLAPTEVLRYE